MRLGLYNFIFFSLKKKKFLSNKTTDKNNTYFYNLNLPLFTYFSTKQKFFFFKNTNTFKNKYFPKLIAFFLSNFFEKLTLQRNFIKLNTNVRLNKFETILINYFSKKFFFFQKQFKGVLHLNELIYILFISLKNKDLFFLRNWLTNFLEKISLKKHKSFLRGFKRLVLSMLNLSSNFLKVNGFFFDIRGKVGVSGNAKKRHTAIKFRSYGYSKIKLRAEQLKFIVRTNTGVLGVTLVITY